jgi:hypothetical protein
MRERTPSWRKDGKAGITNGVEEPIKIIGYADDWMVHTIHH